MTEFTSTSQLHINTNEASPRQFSGGWRAAIFILLLFGLFIGGIAGYQLKATQTPGADSADVGFARDMSIHHAQAVELAKLAYDRSEDEAIRLLAYDLLTVQQTQIGVMSGWLDAWGYPWTASGARMAWMGMPVRGLMPGMATDEEIARLRKARGAEADAIFLQLMIPHHRGGVMMAEAGVDRAQSEVARNLARSIAVSQQYEIENMQQLLQDRGYEPVPETPLMGDMPHS